MSNHCCTLAIALWFLLSNMPPRSDLCFSKPMWWKCSQLLQHSRSATCLCLCLSLLHEPSGVVELPLLLKFVSPHNKALAIPPQRLTLTATGRDMPVSAQLSQLDFKCCMCGRTYKHSLVLRNAGKSAMKVLVVKKPELEPWLSFLPDFGFIQVRGALV